MAYSTPAMVRLILTGTAVEQGGQASELNDLQIQYEIDSVTANIDTRLRNRYQVPFDTNGIDGVPFLIKEICTDIAAYRADLNYRKSREYDNDRMPILLRHNNAERLLENIKRGHNTLNWPRITGEDVGTIVVKPTDGPFITYTNVFEPFPRW